MKITGCKRQGFIDQATRNGGQAIFYVLKCYSSEESFYKIGITVNHVLNRYSNPKLMPYEWKILLEQIGDPSTIWDLERAYKLELDQYHYEPKIKFNGSKTECYRVLNDKLEALLNTYKPS